MCVDLVGYHSRGAELASCLDNISQYPGSLLNPRWRGDWNRFHCGCHYLEQQLTELPQTNQTKRFLSNEIKSSH